MKDQPNDCAEAHSAIRGRPDPTAVPPFDFAGLLRRARRNARMSQREMAEAIGVPQATIARAERDSGTVSLPVLLAVLAVGGIDLVAVDGDGEVEIMRPDAPRDRGNRKLPAHLDAWFASRSENVSEHWRGSVRRSAPVRWALRSRHLPPAAYLPLHHPGPEDRARALTFDDDLQAFQDARRKMLHPTPSSPAVPPPVCTCSDECVTLGAACPPQCPCQCESDYRVTGWADADAPPG